MTTREKAMIWWNDVNCENTSDYVMLLCDKYFGGTIGANHKCLSDWQIEEIWRKETNQQIQDSVDLDSWLDDGSDPKEPQVDFDIVNRFIKKGCVTIDQGEIKNVKLFLKLLSTKPTFAAKAHKELNKLKQ